MTAKNIYIRHFEISYVIIRTQIHHMLYIYAKVVIRRPRPDPTAYGHLVDVLSFKWLIYIQNGGHIYIYIYIYISGSSVSKRLLYILANSFGDRSSFKRRIFELYCLSWHVGVKNRWPLSFSMYLVGTARASSANFSRIVTKQKRNRLRLS